MFDAATHLPAIVRTHDFDQLMGDADFDATFSDWRPVEAMGLKLPFHTVHTLNGVKIFDTTVTGYQMNTSLATDAFNAPGPCGEGGSARPDRQSALSMDCAAPRQRLLPRFRSSLYG
jgi:hypothetical protein